MSVGEGTPVQVRRLACAVAALAFWLSYRIAYKAYVVPVWGYLGFEYEPKPWLLEVGAILLALIPIICFPAQTARSSVVVVLTIYVLVYLPSLHMLVFASRQIPGDALPLAVSFFLGFCIMASAVRLQLPRKGFPAVSGGIFFTILFSLTAVCAAGMAVASGGKLALASFVEASALRSAAAGTIPLTTWPGFGYLFLWTTYVLAPLLALHGLLRRKAFPVVWALVVEVVLYSATTAKVALFAVPLVFILWCWARLIGHGWYGPLLFGVPSALFVVASGFGRFFRAGDALDNFLSFLVVRYFSFQGFSTILHERFLLERGPTQWSHVHGLHSLGANLTDSLPVEMARFGWPGSNMLSAPGHFLAQDGIAAAGAVGVVVASILAVAVLFLLDWVSRPVKMELVVPLLILQGIVLSDSSLFTAFLSDGLLVLVVVFAFSPRILRVPRAQDHAVQDEQCVHGDRSVSPQADG